MKAATDWFKFDPSSIGTPGQGEWCLWSFITKHGRETYSGRWVVHDGSDLIVTDRGWSVPLVVGEAYFARVIPFDNGAADFLVQHSAAKESAELPPFDMVMACGFIVSFSMKTNLKIGDRITFWEKRYIVWDRNEKDGFVKYSLMPDSVPSVEYRGSTERGTQFKIGPPAETMIEDAGESSTFVQDKLAEMIEPELKPVDVDCRQCGHHISSMILSRDVTVRCPHCGTVADIRLRKPKFPVSISIREGDQPK